MFIICSCYWYGMTMNWNLAVERNSVLAMLVAMVGITDQPGAARPTTLPGHLHRFVLGLLRPAESATRRLIIVAARGLMVRLPKSDPLAMRLQPGDAAEVGWRADQALVLRAT